MGVVGQRIRELRKAAKLTQQELADGVVTRSYISQIEKGLIQPSYDTLEKISQKLECTVEELFKEPENKALIVSEWKKSIHYVEGQIESGQYEQARKTIENSNLESIDELSDYDWGLLHWVKGKMLEKNHQYEEAAACFQKSIDSLSSQQTHVKVYIRSIDSLASVYLHMNRNVEALQILNEAFELMIHHQVGGLTRISLLVNSGVAHAKLGEYYSAIRILREASEINHSLSTYYKSGHISMVMGICYMQLANTAEAESALMHAIRFFEMFDEQENLASVYNNLGLLYKNEGKFSKAIETLLRAHSLFEEIPLEHKMVEVKVELAFSFLLNGDLEQASKYCYQIISAKDAWRNRSRAYRILGRIEFERKNMMKSLEYYREAFDLSVEHQLEPERREALKHMAETHFALHEFERAAECYQAYVDGTK